MSYPRHAMIYRDGFRHQWWLEIVTDPYDYLSWKDDENTQDDYERSVLSCHASTFGPFKSPEEAQNYADKNYQNTGFAIPVLDPKIFEFMAPPYLTHVYDQPDNKHWVENFFAEDR